MDVVMCELCGEPMPEGEEAFRYHGSSGPCPKPPLKATPPVSDVDYTQLKQDEIFDACGRDPNKWAVAYVQHAKLIDDTDLDPDHAKLWFTNAMAAAHAPI